MKMTIGKLASEAGVSVQTVRYYERRRILPEPDRTPAGYRQYDGGALARLRFVRRAQELAFSLQEIEELLGLWLQNGSSCSAVEAKTRVKLEDLQRKIGELKRMGRVLEKLAASCTVREATADCPILETIPIARSWKRSKRRRESRRMSGSIDSTVSNPAVFAAGDAAATAGLPL